MDDSTPRVVRQNLATSHDQSLKPVHISQQSDQGDQGGHAASSAGFDPVGEGTSCSPNDADGACGDI